ncbi:MAG: DUF1538 domain-containing protein [Candidatus Vecturithrix sp.]|jgi:hypothetical protein|nr:DUF1538 domain-containing protein [Candidatus Vecturithrix sp.]
MQKSDRIHIPMRVALVMVRNYAQVKVMEQVKSVAFIILYLIGFQILVLKTAPANALQISLGIGMVIFGLTFFLEGLFIGLMPLGERVGVQLPQHSGIAVIIAFGLLLGVGATLAEPAIATLRVAGLTVTPWDAPLLFRLLETEPEKLVAAIGAGVGIAVAFGMIRFYYGISIKLFMYILVPLLLGVSALCALNEKLENILNLAWDTGAVTTGPVTVPFVLALGVGVARSIGKYEDATAGFGIVALASAFPVLGVLALGMWLNPSTPPPLSETAFFARDNRQAALKLVASETDLRRLAFQRGSEIGRRTLFDEEFGYEDALRSLADPVKRQELLGQMSLEDWLRQRASQAERALIAAELAQKPSLPKATPVGIADVLSFEAGLALRAVIPLVALLLIVLFFLLRDKLPRIDEAVLGIVFALIGMTLLTSGIKLGLAPLGDQAGRPLPQVFRNVASEEGRLLLESFDPESVLAAFNPDGSVSYFFYLQDRTGIPTPVIFDPTRFDPQTRRYEHIVERPPLFGSELTLAGIGLVLLFVFGMGYGATMAEPALNALGYTVQELTVGTIKRTEVVHTVSFGVGIGLLIGVVRILYDLSMIWLIIPSYLVLLLLTYWSEEDFTGIALDCGGVTTGPITVPLVLTMGLGIGGELNVVDGFGIVTMASVYPIITVLIYGIVVRARHRQLFQATEEESHEA